nr:MAG TPA: hypothetical protein [Caudoviricetes sp.]
MLARQTEYEVLSSTIVECLVLGFCGTIKLQPVMDNTY